MKRRIFSVLAAVALLSGLLVGALPAQAAPPLPDYNVVDVGPRLRDLDPSAVPLHLDGFEGAEALASAADTGPSFYVVGDTVPALWYDDTMGLYVANYEVRAIGEHIEVWVMDDLDFPTGDPRNPVVVTQEQIDYLVGQFDNNIWPNDTGFFGVPDLHDGSNASLPGMLGLPADTYYDPDGRVIAMISNIGDDNYYDPTYPLYIAGFYWGSVFENYLDRNVISIDAFDWVNRVGPNGSRPYLYEGTFAHEFQHLIHDDMDSDEETWVDEGCADFAQFLCNYGHPDSHVEDALVDYPENSLVLWGDQGDLEILSDYGHAYLWTLYLSEQFGQSFVQAMVANQDNGIAGVNSTLDAFGIQKDFAEIYSDWAVALLINSQTPGGGRYGFQNLDRKLDMGTPDAPNLEAFNTTGAPPWGTDYIWIDGDPKELLKLKFNGLEYSTYPTAWRSRDGALWSGRGNEVDNWAIFEATGGGALTFDTSYDIENEWDFGFVQVSTDGGHTWTSLANEYTVDQPIEGYYPTVVANLPGLTGNSGGWVNMSFDLSAYAGQDILVAFRYVTDWNTTGSGWYIDNVYVDDTLISDCSSTDAFGDITDYVPINNDFVVTFVGFKTKGNEYQVLTLKLDDVTEEGLFELNSVLKNSNQAAMLVTFAAPQGFRQYMDYTYEFGFKSKGPKK